ncbi:MAG TPA: glycosyltransferase [Solirubrobacteraceae bacterium]|nr:glycosyltransferase [Solirubrobacteraceae bacterium]
MHVCTVINKAWVAHARSLAQSLHAHQPDARLSVLIVDPIDGFIDAAAEPFEILGPRDIEIDEFEAMSARYNVTELCCALKPAILRHLLKHGEAAVYLDSDVRVFAPFDGLDDALQEHPFLLTPHLLRPLADDGREPRELAILLAGSFNLGFAAARTTPEVQTLLRWWSERLRTGSRLDPSRGMVFDQRWADLMPGMFEQVGAWRDPGVNAGYWRVATSHFERTDGQLLVDGRPLRSFHFTGFEPERPDRLSKYDSRISLDREPALAEMCAEFARQLAACGHAEASRWPYGFAATASGAPLTDELRGLWDRAAREGAVRETPFASDGERELLEWLAEPDDGAGNGSLNRYLAAVHQARPELCERFPDPYRADRERYLAWAQEEAERHPTGVLGLLRARAQARRRQGLRELAAGEAVGAERGEVVVCIPVYGAAELFAECLRSVLAHTPRDVRILIADDASPDPTIHSFVTSLADVLEHEVCYLRQPENLGFPGNVNAMLAAACPADVVVLNSDCVVASGWLEGLRRAAYSDSLVATASALTNHGTILSVPDRNLPRPDLPQEQDLTRAAGAVLAQSLRLYPKLPTAVGHCMYLRRHALDLVGDFDLAFSPGYGEEVDFSQRCLLHGLVHVAADDVFVLHHAGGTFAEDGEPSPVQKQHERIIDARYPYYQRAQTAASTTSIGRLPRAIDAAGWAISGFAVTIDGRCLGPLVTGTQVHTLQLIRALDATGQIGLRVIVPPDLGAYAARELAARPHIELVPHADVNPDMDKTAVAHRPFQVSSADDLFILRCAGHRQVVTHQDLIAYRNPGYFAGYRQWERYQRLTRRALALADYVVFFSHHAAQDALSEDLVDPARVRVVYIGVDHAAPRSDEQRPPAGFQTQMHKPFLLCLGTDFKHKNRVFALRLLEALRDEQGWDGTLVLAGPRVAAGSSAGEEAAYLAARPELAAAVSTLPAVSEPEKAWLLEHCAAVLYPTTFEGFGLMPFEAADHDRPCLFASQTALAEILPSELATLVAWDPRASAQRVNDLLSRPDSVHAHVVAIRRAGGRFTWQSTAESLIDVYGAAATAPAREATQLAEELELVEDEREEMVRKYNELWQSLTPDARTLVAPDGPLTPAEHRSLAAVAKRPILRKLLLGPVQLAHSITRAGRHEPPPEQPTSSPESFALHFAWANQVHMKEQLIPDEAEPPITEP